MEAPETSECIKFILANTRSVKGKTAELQSLTIDYNIICLTETHIDSTIPNQSIIEDTNKTIFRKDRNLYGGGVLIAVDSSLNPSEIKLSNQKEEMVIVKLDQKIIFFCYYRPHVYLQNIEQLRDSYEEISNRHPDHRIVLLGDMNLPEIEWKTGKLKSNARYKQVHTDFLDMLLENNLQQLVQQPTHVHGNTLDLICTNTQNFIKDISVISPGFSDHYLLSAVINQSRPTEINKKPRIVKLYKRVQSDQYREFMQNVSDELDNMQDPDEMWNYYTIKLLEAQDAYIPTKAIQPKNEAWPEWMDKNTFKLTVKQRKTWGKYQKTGDKFFLKKYYDERRNSKKECSRKKREHLVEKICKPLERGNSKPFYKHLRQSKSNNNACMRLLDDKGNVTDDEMKCAEILNKHFQNQFCQGQQLDNTRQMETTGEDSIEMTVDGLIKLIQNLPNGKSPGPDAIRKPDLLVDIKMSATCIKHIFQASIDTGKLPSQWKLAYVTPVHKGGNLDSANNYRPISLTSIPCKMMEHIILHYLNQKLNGYLHNRQHGFRRGMSCETQLCATYHDLAKIAESSKTTHAVVLDFKKAFDKVPHALLMQKVRQIPDLNPQLINWIQNFLTNRRQRVVIRGQVSSERIVSSGVPQGSVLGPTLFLIYINDLPATVDCNVSLYADDTLLYQQVTSQAEAAVFQTNIDAIHKWSTEWMMPFNDTKCHVIAFGDQTFKPPYNLGDSQMDWVCSTKYLGVILQSDLKFDQHMDIKKRNSLKTLGAIKHILHNAPKNARLLAYTSLCRPILEYADTVWDPMLNKDIESLELVQNRAVRFISRLKGRESVTEAKTKLGLQKLTDRRKSHRFALLMKILQDEDCHSNLATAYDEILQNRANTTMTTRSATRGELTSVYATSQTYHGSFLPRTIRDMHINSTKSSETL